jgi:hypothetical protein
MTRAMASLTAAIIILLAVTAGPARAELVSWHYSWAPNPVFLEADKHGTGGVVFTRESWRQVTGTRDVAAAAVFVFSSASDKLPDRIVNKAYNLTLKLQDDASKTTASLTFGGLLNGTLSWDNTHLTNKFTGHTTQAVHLGHYWYWVTIGPYVAPTVDGHPGAVEAHILVKHNPEPSTWVLAAVGATALALASWRRWARKPVAA